MTGKYAGMMEKAATQENLEEGFFAELAKETSSMVNNFSFVPEHVVAQLDRNPAAQCLALAMAYVWVRHWGGVPEYMFDGRNEASRRLCREIGGTEAFRMLGEVLASMDGKKLEVAETIYTTRYYGETLYTMHKTLMQTYTGFMLCVFDKDESQETGNVVAPMREKYGEKWYRLPLV